MSPRSRAMSPPVLVALAIALVALGAGGMYVVMRARPTQDSGAADRQRGRDTNPAAQGGTPAASPTDSGAPLQDGIITLSNDALVRAGVETALVRPGAGPATLRIPAVVQPNAYRTVGVTSVAAGRINRVDVQLGQQVRRGQTLAEIYSPELASGQSAYLARRAELDAHERELRRTEKLVEIGSASRQELERVHAEHTAALAELETIRSRLTLLGLSAQEIEALSPAAPRNSIVSVQAPIDAVVTSREANVGMNIDAGSPLLTLVVCLMYGSSAICMSETSRASASAVPRRSSRKRIQDSCSPAK